MNMQQSMPLCHAQDHPPLPPRHNPMSLKGPLNNPLNGLLHHEGDTSMAFCVIKGTFATVKGNAWTLKEYGSHLELQRQGNMLRAI